MVQENVLFLHMELSARGSCCTNNFFHHILVQVNILQYFILALTLIFYKIVTYHETYLGSVKTSRSFDFLFIAMMQER